MKRTLRAEQAEFEFTALPSQIDLAEQEQTALLNEIGVGGGGGERGRRPGATRSPRAATPRRRRATASRRRRACRRRRALARARLPPQSSPRRAIERHRAAAQDPLIARAGELFAVATAGSFAGLGVGYDDADQPILVARRAWRADASRSRASAKARATSCFFRCASRLLERRAGEPLPFIGDDLLASFDDERTRHTLDLLAEFGAAGRRSCSPTTPASPNSRAGSTIARSR